MGINNNDVDLRIIEEDFDSLILDSVKSNNVGFWRTYRRDNEGHAKMMFDAVDGKHTGWDIEKSFYRSSFENNRGDTYIYFEVGKNNDLLPKIKIGYMFNQLFDVRGLDMYQALDKEYLMIASNKIQELKEMNKARGINTSSFDNVYSGIRSYFTLAYLGKHPNAHLPKEILLDLYNKKFQGFTFVIPSSTPFGDDMSLIYRDIYKRRNRELDEDIINSTNSKLLLEEKK